MKLQIRKSLSEKELVSACRRFEKRAQEQLFKKYAPSMLALCRRYTGNLHDAEDVMLEGFMKVFQKIGQYQGSGSFEGWIKRIMINEALGFLRKNKSMYVETDIEELEEKPELDRLYTALEVEDLISMIDGLPPGYRIVFNLYAIEGFSHREIGRKLGISENTSKSQLSRARALLRKKLLSIQKSMNEKVLRHEDQ